MPQCAHSPVSYRRGVRMTKNKRPNWQKLGFRSYAEYQKHLKVESIVKSAKATIGNMFEECLDEAINRKAAKEKQHQEAADRLKYHNLRLQYTTRTLTMCLIYQTGIEASETTIYKGSLPFTASQYSHRVPSTTSQSKKPAGHSQRCSRHANIGSRKCAQQTL